MRNSSVMEPRWDVQERCIGGFKEFGYFLGQIDPHGAPSDASAASDATACVELVEPGGQFMGQPLTVARSDGVSDRSA